MPTYVVFSDIGARVVKSEEDVSHFESNPKVVKNPDLQWVTGVAPHFWKLEEGRIIPMTEKEKEQRKAQIDTGSFVQDYSHLQNSGKAELAKKILHSEFAELLDKTGMTPASIQKEIETQAQTLTKSSVENAMNSFKESASKSVKASVELIQADIFTIEQKMNAYVYWALVAQAVNMAALGYLLILKK
jgi:hypothetical protein